MTTTLEKDTWRLRAVLPWRPSVAVADPSPPPAATPGEFRLCQTTAGAVARPDMRTSPTWTTAAAALELPRQSPPLPPDGRHQEESLLHASLNGYREEFNYFFFFLPSDRITHLNFKITKEVNSTRILP